MFQKRLFVRKHR